MTLSSVATAALGRPAFAVLQLFYSPDASLTEAELQPVGVCGPRGARSSVGRPRPRGRAGARPDPLALRGRERGGLAPVARPHARDRGRADGGAAAGRRDRHLPERQRAAAAGRWPRRCRGSREVAQRASEAILGRCAPDRRSRRTRWPRRDACASSRRAAQGGGGVGRGRAAAGAGRLDRAARRLPGRPRARRERPRAAHGARRAAGGRGAERAAARARDGSRQPPVRRARAGARGVTACDGVLRDLALVHADAVARQDAGCRDDDARRAARRRCGGDSRARRPRRPADGAQGSRRKSRLDAAVSTVLRRPQPLRAGRREPLLLDLARSVASAARTRCCSRSSRRARRRRSCRS